MTPVARWKTLGAISAAVVLATTAALAGVLGGLGWASETRRAHAPKPYLRHPEFAHKALLLAQVAGIHVTPAVREAARTQSARPRVTWAGASTRFSVFNHAAAPSQLPAEVRKFVIYAAGASHISRDAALARVKILRSNVGSARGGLYAFVGDSGAPCFILTHYGGTCATAGSSGLAWVIGGGGQDGNPDVLIALAPDDVTAVSLTVDGRNVPVSLHQNVAYAEFPTGSTSAEVATTRVDGTVTTEHLDLNA